MIDVVATFSIKPGQVAKAVELATELVSLTVTENGCVRYNLAQSAEDENQIVILEAWENQNALDVHSASAHFTRLVPALVELCAVPPVITAYKHLL